LNIRKLTRLRRSEQKNSPRLLAGGYMSQAPHRSALPVRGPKARKVESGVPSIDRVL
jgi:hypothetical protein